MNVALSTIALCAGYGGLEIGLSAACEHVGWEHRVAAYVEREVYAAALLACRMEAGALDAAPVWSDLTTFDAGAWRGAVDCVTAGFPCQPHSQAGSRKGVEDERWIWPDIARIVRESGAWLVVLENVAGLLSSGGFAPVLADLAAMGFDAEWGVLSAGSVGASHRRERVFIVGYSERARRAQAGRGRQEHAGRQPATRRGDMGDARLQHQHVQQRNDGAEHPAADGALDNTTSTRRDRTRIGPAAERGSGQCMLGAGCDDVANTAQHGRPQGWSEPSGQQRRPDVAEFHGALAHASGPHSEGGVATR